MMLFENDFVRISIDRDVPCLEWIGKRYLPSQEFRAAERRSFECYMAHKDTHPGLQRFIDTRHIGVVAEEDTTWAAAEMLPKFAAAGLRKEGFVVPSTSMMEATMHNYVSTAGETIQVGMFDDEATAKAWLRKPSDA